MFTSREGKVENVVNMWILIMVLDFMLFSYDDVLVASKIGSR